MRVVKCPKCRRVTEKFESMGTCEHCGVSAMTAGDAIEGEAAEPIKNPVAFGIWRRRLGHLWLAAAAFEFLAFAATALAALFLASALKRLSGDAVEINTAGVLLRIGQIVLTFGIGIWAYKQPIPATWVGLALYVVWIVIDLLISPLALCLTVVRIIFLVGLMAGLRTCIVNR